MSEVETPKLDQGESVESYIEDGKNKLVVRCRYCGSKILEKKAANYLNHEKELPQIHNEKGKEVETELVKDFYHVENMYTFENIGFTHTVGNCKYLSCADCDVGPIGYHNNITKHSYIALCRVRHE